MRRSVSPAPYASQRIFFFFFSSSVVSMSRSLAFTSPGDVNNKRACQACPCPPTLFPQRESLSPIPTQLLPPSARVAHAVCPRTRARVRRRQDRSMRNVSTSPPAGSSEEERFSRRKLTNVAALGLRFFLIFALSIFLSFKQPQFDKNPHTHAYTQHAQHQVLATHTHERTPTWQTRLCCPLPGASCLLPAPSWHAPMKKALPPYEVTPKGMIPFRIPHPVAPPIRSRVGSAQPVRESHPPRASLFEDRRPIRITPRVP